MLLLCYRTAFLAFTALLASCNVNNLPVFIGTEEFKSTPRNHLPVSRYLLAPIRLSRQAAVTPPQVSNGNTLRTTTLFAARLPSDIACV